MPSNSPRLWVVATPLGNPGDLSPRARECLEAADIVLAEDTRREALACDVDRDGQITSADARLILRAAVGLETLSV